MSRYPDTVGLELAGAEEVAELIGVPVELVPDLPRSEQLARTGPVFPAPLAVLEQGPVWDRADVERWYSERQELWRQTRTGPLGRRP